MTARKPVEIVLLILKIFVLFVLVGCLVFLSYLLIGVRVDDIQNAGTEGYFSGYGLQFFLSALLLFAINLSGLVVCVVGFFVAKYNRHCKENKRQRKHFLRLMFVPLVNQLAFILLAIVLAHIE